MRISDWSSDVCSSDLRKLADANEALSVAREARAGAAARAEALEARRQEMNRIAGERFECPPPLLPERVGFDPDEMKDASQCSKSEEHTSELQSLMRISYAVFCLKKKIERQSIH